MSNYRLTAKGKEAYDRMDGMYAEEIARQEREYGTQYTEYGWSCIDDYEHIHDIDDDIDLLVFGYEEHIIDTLIKWGGEDGFDSAFSFGYSIKEIISRIAERGLLEVVR